MEQTTPILEYTDSEEGTLINLSNRDMINTSIEKIEVDRDVEDHDEPCWWHKFPFSGRIYELTLYKIEKGQNIKLQRYNKGKNKHKSGIRRQLKQDPPSWSNETIIKPEYISIKEGVFCSRACAYAYALDRKEPYYKDSIYYLVEEATEEGAQLPLRPAPHWKLITTKRRKGVMTLDFFNKIIYEDNNMRENNYVTNNPIFPILSTVIMPESISLNSHIFYVS